MRPIEPTPEDGLSLVALGTAMLRHRWLIARWMIGVGAIAAFFAFMKAPSYAANAAFIPQGQQGGAASGLAGLAGQFGVTLPTATPSLSPEFYQGLLHSRVLLVPIVNDSFAVSELGGRRVGFLDLFEIEGPTPLSREERAVRELVKMIGTTVNKPTGVVEVTVVTPWRSVSLQVAERLLAGINEYNQSTRQSTAAAERKAIEVTLANARRELTAAEDELERFSAANRQIGGSSATARERLSRNVDLKTAVYTTLAQSYEEARIREVRETAAIAIFEPVWAPTYPQPRGRVLRVILGLFAGALIAMVIVFFRAVADMRREAGDREFDAFLGTVADVRRELTRPFRRERTAAS